MSLLQAVKKWCSKALIATVLLLTAVQSYGQADASARKALKLMGCGFEVSAVADNDSIAWRAINAGILEIQRIERLISSWDEASQTSEINRMAGVKPVKVDKELFDLIYRAKKISGLTQGAFDISFASMDKIWVFDRAEKPLPDSNMVATARATVGYENIVLNSEDTTVFLKKEGMKIGFGAIGKGYAANRARDVMKAIPGVKGGVVNASGDLLVWGKSNKPEGWTINISDPKDKSRAIAWLQIEDMAVVTSGNYEKYFTSEGRRFAHIVDPQTGYPTQGVTSVTLICPDAELADALATSVFVLGKAEGLALIDQLNGVEGIVIEDDGSISQSKNLNLNYY